VGASVRKCVEVDAWRRRQRVDVARAGSCCGRTFEGADYYGVFPAYDERIMIRRSG
jgi:hypothetical protein